MKPRVILIGLLLYLQVFCATKKSTGSGNWSTGASWSAVGVPLCGDSIIIQSGHSILVNSNQNYLGCGSRMVVVVQGTLNFDNNSKLRLPCNAVVYILDGGRVQSISSSANDRIEICGTVYWSGDDGALIGPLCLPANSCFSVLGTRLTFFSVNACDHRICADWQTSVGFRYSSFELQKSADGDRYESVSQLSVTDNLPSRNHYSLADAYPFAGVTYYWLRTIGPGGEENFSKVETVVLEKPSVGYTVDNSGNFQMSYRPVLSESGTTVRLTITNLLGQLLFSSERNLSDNLIVFDGLLPANEQIVLCRIEREDGSTFGTRMIR
jgi:hypothetical protein